MTKGYSSQLMTGVDRLNISATADIKELNLSISSATSQKKVVHRGKTKPSALSLMSYHLCFFRSTTYTESLTDSHFGYPR